MSVEDLVNLLDEIKCQLELLNENFETYFRIVGPAPGDAS